MFIEFNGACAYLAVSCVLDDKVDRAYASIYGDNGTAIVDVAIAGMDKDSFITAVMDKAKTFGENVTAMDVTPDVAFKASLLPSQTVIATHSVDSNMSIQFVRGNYEGEYVFARRLYFDNFGRLTDFDRKPTWPKDIDYSVPAWEINGCFPDAWGNLPCDWGCTCDKCAYTAPITVPGWEVFGHRFPAV